MVNVLKEIFKASYFIILKSKNHVKILKKHYAKLSTVSFIIDNIFYQYYMLLLNFRLL
jgi:hypothetical protein